MKSVIKFLVMASLAASVMAAPIQVFYEEEPSRAQLVKNIFIEAYHIPEDLVAISEVRGCEELDGGGKLDLCLKKNGDLLIVSVNRSFISESLKIFQAP